MDMNLAIFLSSAVMISLSGVLSPGPMTAAALQHGSRSAFTGIYIALGHAVIEMPLIFLIYLGVGNLLHMEGVRITIGIAGGIYLLFIGIGLLRPRVSGESSKATPSSFFSGIFLSGGNPYFLLWWATIGAGLVIGAARFGLLGLILFAILHWLCDLIWYSFLSFASFKGIKMFGAGLYKKVSVICGLAMLFYGGTFIVSALNQIIVQEVEPLEQIRAQYLSGLVIALLETESRHEMPMMIIRRAPGPDSLRAKVHIIRRLFIRSTA